ncbi:uncharacterized protein EI97DRAFT_233418 [Westerdykella ornata]|uniref:Uncharacterized protein n=1 Tax=Westerdykella ornata TaxID=318751 RepID=A0A6A6J712_WESOR|nr:uncharacterized protein EI97DRAFT_233418 [Westerdykella ornata]KAF2272185.1 hypothetical protein EI97DRAFT_233418 [Westerdykella ornata]
MHRKLGQCFSPFSPYFWWLAVALATSSPYKRARARPPRKRRVQNASRRHSTRRPQQEPCMHTNTPLVGASCTCTLSCTPAPQRLPLLAALLTLLMALVAVSLAFLQFPTFCCCCVLPCPTARNKQAVGSASMYCQQPDDAAAASVPPRRIINTGVSAVTPHLLLSDCPRPGQFENGRIAFSANAQPVWSPTIN